MTNTPITFTDPTGIYRCAAIVGKPPLRTLLRHILLRLTMKAAAPKKAPPPSKPPKSSPDSGKSATPPAGR